MTKGEKAKQLFDSGLNCCQAVVLSFADELGIDEKTLYCLSSSFGGGFGRMREVCGAVSGMVMVLGALYGYDNADADEAKKDHYTLVQKLAGKFREENGSIICRDILKNPPSDPAPSPRTAQYYADRPCARMVYTAAKILEDYIAEHPYQ